VTDYDFYLRDGGVNGGAWTGFVLAWKGLAGVPGFPAMPYRQWMPWILDPASPDDPTLGHWGVLQWRFSIALLDGIVGPHGLPADDGRTAAQMRADLFDFTASTGLELMDLDGVVYRARVTAYDEQLVEPYDLVHSDGGRLAVIELAQSPA